MVNSVYCTPLLLSNFTETFNFLGVFSENTQILNFIEIRPVGAELFRADLQSDGHDWKLLVALRNSVNSPKKECWYK